MFISWMFASIKLWITFSHEFTEFSHAMFFLKYKSYSHQFCTNFTSKCFINVSILLVCLVYWTTSQNYCYYWLIIICPCRNYARKMAALQACLQHWSIQVSQRIITSKVHSNVILHCPQYLQHYHCLCRSPNEAQATMIELYLPPLDVALTLSTHTLTKAQLPSDDLDPDLVSVGVTI